VGERSSATSVTGGGADGADLGWVADILAAHRDEVMQRWVGLAARQPFHFGRRELAISNNLAQVYDAVVVLLGTQPGTADAGTAWVDPDALRAAEDHARDRIAQGLEPTDVVVEFRLLREETGRALLAHLPPAVAAGDAIRAILLMNSVFDGALMVLLGVLTRHVDEARAAVLATATHDLAQPLTAIKGAVDLVGRVLGRPQPDLARAADAQRRARAGMDHVATLLARLADGARLALGTADLRPADVDLGEAVRAAVGRLDADRAGRVWLEAPAAGEATGHWDAVGLGRVVDNLLSNALKYSPPETPVRVAVQRQDDVVELSVSDLGVGLDKEEIGRLFRRYQRAQGAIVSAVAGTGLGLYSARAIVEAHRGRIWATSAGRGQGTTVHVLLPRAALRDAPAGNGAPA
jgi:signal transduction histidine kinase